MNIEDEFLDGSRALWDDDHYVLRLDDANNGHMLQLVANTGIAAGSCPAGDTSSIHVLKFLNNNFSGVPKLTVPPLHAQGAEVVDHNTTSLSETTSTQSKIFISIDTPTRNSFLAIDYSSQLGVSKPNTPRVRQRHRRFTAPEPLRRLPDAQSGKGDPEAETKEESRPYQAEHLRRNRVAASRCRKNKKEWARQLEETQVELEQQSVSLQMEHKRLVDEVHWLKNQVMVHAGCHNSNIDKWIGLEAMKVVKKSLGQYTTESGDVILGGHQQHPNRGLYISNGRQTSFSESSSTRSSHAEINYDHMPDEVFELEP